MTKNSVPANTRSSMGFYQDFQDGLKSQIGEGKRFKTNKAFADYCGVPASQTDRYLKGITRNHIEALGNILDKVGAKLVFPERDAVRSREVCFVDIKSSLAQSSDLPVVPENYVAVPLVSEAGAGPGIIRYDDDEPEEWFLVNRSAQSMFGRKVDQFFAVRIASNSTSMEPTLHPGDTVLVDPNDKAVHRPGGIFLVMEPDGSGKIKRVNVEKVPALKLTRLTFYSDNVQENPPEVHNLELDYDGDVNRAIVGRVIWAWTDLSRK